MSKTDTQPIPGMNRIACERIDYVKLATAIAEQLKFCNGTPGSSHECVFDDETRNHLKAMAKAYSEGRLIPGLDDDTIRNMKTFSAMASKASAIAYGLLITTVVGSILAAFGKGLISMLKG